MIPYEKATDFLNDLLKRRVEGEFPRVTGTCLYSGMGGGVTEEHTPGEYFVRVGTKKLGDLEKGVRPEDLAWVSRTAMHERRHVYQKSDIYQKPMSGRDLDMAIMECCAGSYHGYDNQTYGFRLSELDADKHGGQDAIPELKAAFPDIDWDQAMLNAYNEHNQPNDDAVFSAVDSHAFQYMHTYQSLDEVWAYYDKQMEIYTRFNCQYPLQEFIEDDDRVVFDNRWDEKFFKLLDGDGTKTGSERNREIFASALQARVFDFEAFMPGLKPEIEKIKAEYGVEPDSVRKVKQMAWDADHKNDPEDTFEAMFGMG